MKLVGRFTCGACKMYCSIDRFEVAGRRFPFGGRCSLFENVWKRKSRTAAAPDLVEQRAELALRHAPAAARKAEPAAHRHSEGADDALALSRSTRPSSPALGMEVVLSGVDPRGELKSYSGFCFPVADRPRGRAGPRPPGRRSGLPPARDRACPRPNPCRDSYLCPITQAGPYFLAKAFPDVRFLSPVLDFTSGYEASPALVDMAVAELGIGRGAGRAGLGGRGARPDGGRTARCASWGSGPSSGPWRTGKPTILLAGHSYNAFTPEASQSVGKKLSSMGITVIPADCLAPVEEGPTAWHFANQILNAVALGQAASQPVPAVREQLQLHDRCLHPLHAGLRAGHQAVPDPGDRRPHRRRRRADPPGGLPRHHPELPRGATRPPPAVHPLPARRRRPGHPLERARRCRSTIRG